MRTILIWVLPSLFIIPQTPFAQPSFLSLQPRTLAVVNDTLTDAYIGGTPLLYWPRLAVADINRDGQAELFVGNSSGRIMQFRYTNLGFHRQFVLMTDFYGGIDVGLNALPCFYDIDDDVDLDNDFDPDTFTAHVQGGISFWENSVSWADFGWQAEGLSVAFQDSSHAGAIEKIWDFGDGHVATGAQAEHHYAESGIYEVCLAIRNDCIPHLPTGLYYLHIYSEDRKAWTVQKIMIE